MKQYTKQEAKKEIQNLVQHFERNIQQYKNSNYNEAQAENDFIKPLFGFLNWNVYNRDLEPERQVFNLQVTGATGRDSNKRPDYLIRIPDKNSNTMKSAFFIEAKKPIYNLKTNEKYIRQVYQYAWSTLNSSDNPNNQVRLAILTDFEEFRFFDCQDVTPLKQNRAEGFNKYAIKDWTYKDYVTQFDDLWDLFEYNNVVNGSLDKWYITSKDLADKRITPDKQFMFDLKEWRLAIAKSMLKNDKSLDDFSLTKATLLFINRIIFVKMLADRNIEDDYLTQILEKLAQSKKSELKLFELCRDIFTRLDHIYNGSMFTYDALVDELVIDNSVLKSIFTALKPEISIYTLAAMPVEIIGNIYELFIAEQIVKKGTTLQIVSKYDEKKAGGVYYTPRYIVQYIVDNTLGKLLDDCKTPEQVAKIKVLDPACGSGSFLIVAYQKIIDWYKTYYFNELNKWTKKSPLETFRTKNNRNLRVISGDDANSYSIHLSHKLKSDILTNNIFGVDIDDQAVLVTKFSLSMKALEDSSHDEVIEDNSLYKIPTLPKLENNIKCGNSLIASDFYNENRPSLFNEKEKRKINTFDWDGKNGFPEIMKNGGFDVVIGNPPYRTLLLGKKQESQDQNIIDYYQKKYTASFEYKINLFALFMEQVVSLMGEGCYFSFIIPNTFYNTISFKSLRKFMLNKGHFESLLDLRYKVFVDAEIGGSAIYIFNKNLSLIESSVCSIKNIENFNIMNFEKVLKSEFLNDLDFNLIQNKYANQILKKINNQDGIVELGKIIKIYQGIITGDNKKYLSQNKIDNKWYPIIKGRDINRYSLTFNNNFVYYSPKDLWSNTDINMFKVKEKIISRQTSDKIISTIDTDGYFSLDSTHVIHLLLTDLNLKYLLGIYNSKLFNFLYQNRVQESGRVFAQIKTVNLKPIPIKTIDFTNKEEKAKHDKMVSLVEQMLENQKYLSEAKTESNKQIYQNICDSLDKQIDNLVYKLYNLTYDEVKIVDPEFAIKKEEYEK